MGSGVFGRRTLRGTRRRCCRVAFSRPPAVDRNCIVKSPEDPLVTSHTRTSTHTNGHNFHSSEHANTHAYTPTRVRALVCSRSGHAFLPELRHAFVPHGCNVWIPQKGGGGEPPTEPWLCLWLYPLVHTLCTSTTPAASHHRSQRRRAFSSVCIQHLLCRDAGGGCVCVWGGESRI